MKYTIDRDRNGFYIVGKKNGKNIYFGGIRQGKPQFYIFSSYVRHFKTEETARKALAKL